MRLVVMKFGGTSVEDVTAIDRTAKIVAGRIARGQQPIVVVSAMAKVTDQLLSRSQCSGTRRPRWGACHQRAAALPASRHRLGIDAK